MRADAGRSMLRSARGVHARQFAWGRTPSLAELRRRQEVPEGTWEPASLTAMLGARTADVWDEGSTDVVDIYLSAGPREKDDQGTYRSCAPLNTANCSLFHLRFSLKQKNLLAWRIVSAASSGGFSCMDEEARPGFYGTTEPALSPTYGHLAATRRCHRADATSISAAVQVWDSSDNPGPTVYEGSGDGIPQYPNWVNDELLLYNTNDGSQYSIWYAKSWPDFTSTPVARFGPEAGGTRSFQDANVSHDAVDAEGHEARIVTFGGTGTELIPRVIGRFGERPHEFGLPIPDGPVQFSECHHPAWRPDGHQILCTRYQAAETMDVTETSCEVRRLFGFTYDGVSAWTDPTALVEVMSRDDFNAIFVDELGNKLDLFPPRSYESEAGTCSAYVWKFAEWCVSNRYLIATVYCSDADPEASIGRALASRVVLIDLYSDTSSTLAYTDLTAYVEAKMGVEAGSYDAVYATCGAVPAVEEL